MKKPWRKARAGEKPCKPSWWIGSARSRTKTPFPHVRSRHDPWSRGDVHTTIGTKVWQAPCTGLEADPRPGPADRQDDTGGLAKITGERARGPLAADLEQSRGARGDPARRVVGEVKSRMALRTVLSGVTGSAGPRGAADGRRPVGGRVCDRLRSQGLSPGLLSNAAAYRLPRDCVRPHGSRRLPSAPSGTGQTRYSPAWHEY
ncbi:hypothetical protein DES45_107250 [Microvirga subterranea]|uniref:Uncharacterized protein n=1 Tax=Microvirga subterranea TaxID=186651 RepID=A0A370HHM4_9HYPH|nr:hypothetical protein DES45_107250 [Microvirga subterranea]